MNREQWGEKRGLRKQITVSYAEKGRRRWHDANKGTKLVCNPRMDMEHAVLAELVELIRGICAIGNARDCRGCILTTRDKCHSTASELMDALASYVWDHFRYEEGLMEGVASQVEMADHKADHHFIQRRLLAQMEEFKHSGNTAVVSHQLIAELENWIAHHIQAHDAVLASHVASEESQ